MRNCGEVSFGNASFLEIDPLLDPFALVIDRCSVPLAASETS
jgi:hypothetical protein